MRKFAIAMMMLTACVVNAHGDIVIDSYSDANNDRFTNDGTFILNGRNLSGIGQGSSGKWATAISRNVIISAAHFHPAVDELIYFYPGNDPTAAPEVRRLISGQKIASNNPSFSTDLYIGVLDSNLSSNIQHFSYANEFLTGTPPSGGDDFTLSDAGSLQDLNAYLFGLSPFDETSSVDRFVYNDQAVGRNRVTGFAENVVFGGNSDNDALIFYEEVSGDADFVTYEAQFRGGDSGGPTFVDIGGELVLVGTNAFINDAGDTEFSGVNYIGNQAAFIDNFINANAVPEPGSGALAMGIFSLFVFYRRRQAIVS